LFEAAMQQELIKMLSVWKYRLSESLLRNTLLLFKYVRKNTSRNLVEV
jgi:hypothetical protein